MLILSERLPPARTSWPSIAAARAGSKQRRKRSAFYNALGYAVELSYAVELGHLMLRESDLYLPGNGWGRIVLAASASRVGTAWTDHGPPARSAT